MNDLHWFVNDGGPLAVLPHSPAPIWEGTDRPTGGRVVHARSRFDGDPATDYDRACDVDESVEILASGNGWVLALGGVVQAAAWLRLSDDEFLLVSEDSVPDNSAAAMLAMYQRMNESGWLLVRHDVPIGSGGLVLSHAGSTLGDAAPSPYDRVPPRGFSVIGDGIVYPATPGLYRLEVDQFDPPDNDLLSDEYRGCFVRFTRTGSNITMAAG